jgi:hypothetical protein
MHLNLLYLALELGAAGFFAWAALAALRRGRLPFLELASAAVFGILLEEGDQLIFQTYHYSPDFLLTIDRAPIVIGLTWALILAGAMRITDALGVRRRWAPFVDAILALSLDLAFDAIAIRIGLWTWSDLSLTDGWFGVPAGNFYAWLWVTFAFSLVTRLLRDAAVGRPRLELLQLLVPIPAYAILLVGLMPFSFLKPLVDPRPGGGLWLFGLTLVAFCAVGAYGVWGLDRAAPNGERTAILELGVSFTSRLAIHGFFLAALLVMGIAWKVPMLLLVAVVLVGAEWPLARLVRGRGAAVTGQATGPARVEHAAASGANLPAELP